jgi:NADH dehydrogenase [ubiquinone] 1 alpha subcomplex assembly factor 7
MDPAVPEARRDAPDGTIYELCPGAAATVYEVAGRLMEQGGAALFIDYGHDSPREGSTLQAVRAHLKVDPFLNPGEADLTAHVDFAALAPIAELRGVRWIGTVPQGRWRQGSADFGRPDGPVVQGDGAGGAGLAWRSRLFRLAANHVEPRLRRSVPVD